jgi:hypothetical protein
MHPMPSSHDLANESLEDELAPVTVPTPPPVSEEAPKSRVIVTRGDTIPAPPPVMTEEAITEEELPPTTERTPKA